MKNKPDLGFWKLWNLSFGFFGVQIAYALQSAQVSRIFSTIGADPHDLSYFWILPPLMGLIVQPIVGSASDRTWNKLGRRLPYLLFGALVAIIVMCFLPNSGSLGLTVSSAIIFGLIMLMLLDTSINMAMQPFKMLVGDFVNEKQKAKAYSIQSLLCNAGSVVGFAAPFVLAMFLSNTAEPGKVPATVTWSFYIGAIVLALCVVYTFMKIKEMPPAQYNEYHGIEAKPAEKKSENMLVILKNAPKVFWTVGLVQFFCWAAFLYMWTYGTDAIAGQAYGAPSIQKIEAVKIDGKEYAGKYIFANSKPVIDDGKLAIEGINIDGTDFSPLVVTVGTDTVIKDGGLNYVNGVSKYSPDGKLADAGATVTVDGKSITVNSMAVIVSRYSKLGPDDKLIVTNIANKEKGTGEYVFEEAHPLPSISSPKDMEIVYHTVLNTASKEYQDAGDWNGILLAIQAIAAVLWALVLPMFKSRKVGYSISLLIGGLGFISTLLFTNPWMLAISYALVGCAWAAMLAMPFTILTNALSGNHIGTYLGLFNCTICIPQIVAALCGGLILNIFPVAANGAPRTVMMLVVSGVLLVLGALAVWIVKETYGSQQAAKQ